MGRVRQYKDFSHGYIPQCSILYETVGRKIPFPLLKIVGLLLPYNHYNIVQLDPKNSTLPDMVRMCF